MRRAQKRRAEKRRADEHHQHHHRCGEQSKRHEKSFALNCNAFACSRRARAAARERMPVVQAKDLGGLRRPSGWKFGPPRGTEIDKDELRIGGAMAGCSGASASAQHAMLKQQDGPPQPCGAGAPACGPVAALTSAAATNAAVG
jgi:hypothetical protein